MGNTVWVLKEGQEDDEWDHSLILQEDKELMRLAKELGVKTIDDLLDYSILNEEFGEVEDEPFFLNPSEITPTLEALIAAIKNGQSRLQQPDELLAELEDCLKKVVEAQNSQIKVRLSVVP